MSFIPPTRIIIVCTTCLTTALVCPPTALAQSAGNKAAAEAIFDQGKALMQSGSYPQACLKFEASQKLDAGIGTLLYLADCYEKTGRTASAWATFKEAASMAGAQGQEGRQKLATQRARALEPGLLKLTINVAADNDSILGFEVRLDGVAIPPAQYASPFPVDPGMHRVEASAPGKRSYVEAVDVTRGAGNIDIPRIGDLEAPQTTLGETTPPPPANEINPRPVAAIRRGSVLTDEHRAQRTWAYVAGSLGVVGLGLGAYYGLAAIHDNSLSKDDCQPDPNLCGATGYSQRQDALKAARTSTIAFAAGGALVATGAILYFTSQPGAQHRLAARANMSPTGAWAGVESSW